MILDNENNNLKVHEWLAKDELGMTIEQNQTIETQNK